MRRSKAQLVLEELAAEVMLAGATPSQGAAAVIATTSIFLSSTSPRSVDAYLSMLGKAAKSIADSEARATSLSRR